MKGAIAQRTSRADRWSAVGPVERIGRLGGVGAALLLASCYQSFGPGEGAFTDTAPEDVADTQDTASPDSDIEDTTGPDTHDEETTVPVPDTSDTNDTSAEIGPVPECNVHADCPDDRPFCDPHDKVCVECLDALDCSAAKPVCASTVDGARCITGYTVCGGDDAREHSDDGLRGATQLALGTPASGRICGDSADPANLELDWYAFTIGSTRDLEITLSWADTDVDLDLALFDTDLETARPGGSSGHDPETIWVEDLPAGTYYVVVDGVEGAPRMAVPYDVVVYDITTRCDRDAQCRDATRPVCDLDTRTCVGCRDDLDCGVARPVCAPGSDGPACVAGYEGCTGDDGKENGDDGAGGASPLTIPSTVARKICGRANTASGAERDWFELTLGERRDVEITLIWDDPADYLGLELFDASLTPIPTETDDWYLYPTTRWLDALAPGTYYLAVRSLLGPTTVATGYRLDVAWGLTCSQDTQCTNPLRPLCEDGRAECVACLDFFDCPAEKPVCSTRWGGCRVIDYCSGDDAREHRDDGPAGATAITGDTARIEGRICGQEGSPSEFEMDWYVLNPTAARLVTTTLTWANTAVDLDLYLTDAASAILGEATTNANPEQLLSMRLSPGTHYLIVVSRTGAPTAAIPYTLDVLATAVP